MKPVRKTEKAKKKDVKKRLQTGEWTIPEKVKEPMEPVAKIERFNWADEA